MSVLLLNASYEPLHIISTRRALGLILAGKADLLEAGSTEMRSPSHTFPVPVVLRLRYMVRIPFAARVPLNRKTLKVRDNGECQVVSCRERGTTIDHVVPRSRSGDHSWTNVVLMCADHNLKKADRLLDELGWQLKTVPRAPRQHQLVLASQTAHNPV
ncbi:MAG: HNH endonuclease [Acidimicrobiaceae bacterium]|nr:HNH endonuclease [Acidimicrobiaceae bacterium]